MEKYVISFLFLLMLVGPTTSQNITENTNIVVENSTLEVYDAWELEGEIFSPKSLGVEDRKPRNIKATLLDENFSRVRQVDVNLDRRGSLYWLSTPVKGSIIFYYTLDAETNSTVSFSHPTVIHDGRDSHLIRKVRTVSSGNNRSADLGFPKKFTEKINHFSGGMQIKSVYSNRSSANRGRTLRLTLEENVRDYTNLFERVEIRPRYDRPSNLEYTVNKKADPNFDGYSYFLGKKDEIVDIPRDSIVLPGNPGISSAKNADKVARSNCERPIYTISDVKASNQDVKVLNICIPETSKPRFTLNFKTIQNLQQEKLSRFKKKLTYQTVVYHPETPSKQELVVIEPEDSQIVLEKGGKMMDVEGREIIELRKGEKLGIIITDIEQKKILLMNSGFLILSLIIIAGTHLERLTWSFLDYAAIFLTYVLTLFSAFGLEKLFAVGVSLPLFLIAVVALTLNPRIGNSFEGLYEVFHRKKQSLL